MSTSKSGSYPRNLGPGSPIDEFLLVKIASGDEDAFALLYDRYAKPAFSLAYRILEDALGAEDVVQDVFLSVWRSASSFDTKRGQARSWLLSMVHHRAIDFVRRRRGHSTRELPSEPVDWGTSSDEVWSLVASNLQAQAIEEALCKLPEDQHVAIELAYFKGHTHKEIANILGEPLGTIKSRIRIGMEKLRKSFTERGAIRKC